MELNKLSVFKINNKNNDNNPQVKRFGVSCPNLAPLKQDTISFKGNVLKKSDFDGIDLSVIEKFKPNIQQFKSKEDLQTFAEYKIKQIKAKDFGGRQEETKIQRKLMLKEWFDYVIKENDAYNNATKLIILTAITKGLGDDNDTLPPVLNKGVLADTVTELEERLKLNSKDNFDFNKMYQNRLRNYYLEDTNTGETGTKWVVIPSKKHDPKNFEKNVERLKTLSHKSWCTKSYNALPYLSKGDFHVYLENGQPKLGVRFEGNKIIEIQGEKNNSVIPQEYFEVAMKHINEENLKLKSAAKEEIKDSEKLYTQIKQIQKDLATAIKENDVAEILKYWGMKVEEDKDGFLHLIEYRSQFNQDTPIYFDDVGIDENKLFEKIKEVNGRIFIDKSSNIKSFGALEKAATIYITHANHNIIKVPNLKELGSLICCNNDIKQINEIVKNVDVVSGFKIKEFTNNVKAQVANGKFDAEKIFEACGIKTKKDKDGFLTISEYRPPSGYHTFEMFGIDENKLMENVKRIEGDAYIAPESNLKSLKNVEQIGGRLGIFNELDDLGKLKQVGDFRINSKPKIKNLGQIKSIEKDLDLRNNKNINSLGELEIVGGSLHIEETPNITSLGKLIHVGKSLYLTDTNVTDLGTLEYVGEDAWFNRTKIKDLSRLKHVGEYLYIHGSKIKYSDYKHITRNHNPLFYIWDKIWYCARDKD